MFLKTSTSRPETSLKRDCRKVFSCESCTIFQKALFTEKPQITAPAGSSVPT